MNRSYRSLVRFFLALPLMAAFCITVMALVSCGVGVNTSVSGVAGSGKSAAGKEKRYKGRALFERLNGGAELVLEYGVDELRETNTKTAGGEVVASMWTMASDAGAFGLYASRKGDAPRPPAEVGDASLDIEGLEVRFVKGNVFCEVVYQGSDTEAGRKEVAREVKKLDAAITKGSGLPGEIAALPEKHRIPWSEQLALGPLAVTELDEDNVLGVSAENPLGMAQYRADDAGGYFTLGLLRAGSANRAAARLESAAKSLEEAGYTRGKSPVKNALWLESKDFGGWLLAVRGRWLVACMNVRDSSRLAGIVESITP